MSAEITHPENPTYWIITDGTRYGDGVTNPDQVTTVGNGWTLHWTGTDYLEYVNQCNLVNLAPTNTDGVDSIS
jgi:hypothetical protein